MNQVIAMHGWGINSDMWHRWKEKFQNLQWEWTDAERGYGYIQGKEPSWLKEEKVFTCKRRLFIGHSLGTHLVKKEVLQNATDIVLLYSFSSFIPMKDKRRSIKIALEAMHNYIGTKKEDSMHRDFLVKADYLLNPSNEKNLKISTTGRQKLKDDLKLLINTKGLPKCLNTNARVLIINAGLDKIVCSESQETLYEDSKMHFKLTPKILNIPLAGHIFLSEQVFEEINNWIKL